MKKILPFLIVCFLGANVHAQYYDYYGYSSYSSSSYIDSSSSFAKFFMNRRHYTDINYPLAFGLHHSIVQIDGCNGEWGFWFEVAGIELGMGIDGKTYNEALVSKEEHSWFGGNSSKITYNYEGMKASSFITYLGAYIRDWISVGVVFDYDYGKYRRKTVQYYYGVSYLDSDFDEYGPFTDGNPNTSWGIYVKGNYHFSKNCNVFLLGRACLNGNNALVLGFGVNI